MGSAMMVEIQVGKGRDPSVAVGEIIERERSSRRKTCVSQCPVNKEARVD